MISHKNRDLDLP